MSIPKEYAPSWYFSFCGKGTGCAHVRVHPAAIPKDTNLLPAPSFCLRRRYSAVKSIEREKDEKKRMETESSIIIGGGSYYDERLWGE